MRIGSEAEIVIVLVVIMSSVTFLAAFLSTEEAGVGAVEFVLFCSYSGNTGT